MKTLVKTLFVWLLLLALPFQGYASATMLPCAPVKVKAVSLPDMSSSHHDHHAMLAAMAKHQSGADVATSAHHDGNTCKSCSACCPANLMAHAIDIAADTPHFATVPFATGFVPAVDLAPLERPPQTIPA
ncbi:MAG: hypothetical protein JWP59_298 [Massilia sp.]|nr:hypothetical protein [Massilia sp.]